MTPTRAGAVIALFALVAVAACGGIVYVALTADPGPAGVPPAAGAVPDPKPPAAPPQKKAAPEAPAAPRRLPVAGRPGFFVVIRPDGSAVLEDPTGETVKLADAGPALVPVEPKAALPRPKPAGQLIVCDEGVVDVPVGALITLIAKDKVVTRDEQGGATTYYTDGRVEHRGRSERTDVPPRKP